MIHVECPDCSKSYDVAEELAGKAAKCRECGGRIPIPQLSTENATSERAKPTPIKESPPKASAAPPAKSKPAAKPKPAPKKREEDFFEDDVEEVEYEIEDYDEVEEEIEEEWDTPKRSSTRRKKKSGSGAKQYGRIGAFVASGTGKLAWRIWLVGMFVVGLMGFLFFILFAIGFFMRPNLGGGAIGAVMFGMLWLGFKGVRGKGIPVGPDYTMEGFAAELVGSLLVLLSNPFGWFVILMMVGFVRFQNGMLVVGPQNPVPAVQPNIENAPDSQPATLTSTVAGPTGDSFQVTNIPIPEFQDLSAMRSMAAGVTNVMCGESATKPGKQPGSQMQFAYFEPVGTHPSKSLPCVIMANGGTVLMSGIDAPSSSRNPDVSQYIAAGFAVLGISLDGKITNLAKPSLQDLRLAYSEFREAQAGLVNVRNGVEFLKQKVPQVDPNRLFVAGHSSAGTLALLAAAFEPRLKGCVAYCPASDGATLMRGFLNDPRAEIAYPGITQFAKRVSPISHVASVSCPIFLFHAADDQTIPVSDSRRLHQLLDSQGKRNTYVEVPTGAHDIAVVQQGIPSALQWLRPLAGLKGDAGTPATQIAPTNIAKSTVSKETESPTFPNIAPQNIGGSAGALQPSGRAVTFRFSTFSGKGDPAAAARQALRNVSWADLNDIVIDQATSEIRIGQLGGFANSEPARQALLGAGFQLVGGVSIGAKKPASSTTPEPTRPANTEPAAPTTSTPAENPFTTKTPPAKAATKPATPAVAEPAAPKESGSSRRVVTFRYERYSGKGSSVNAAVAALKKVKWADPDDIEVDTAKREIRVGQLEESKEYGPAEKSLKDAGFSLTPGVTSGLRKR